jgi:hypothetical protein
LPVSIPQGFTNREPLERRGITDSDTGKYPKVRKCEIVGKKIRRLFPSVDRAAAMLIFYMMLAVY